MVCEQILGKLSEFDTSGKTIEYVDIEWHEAFKKIHKKTTDHGTELGIRMDDSILTRGLYQDGYTEQSVQIRGIPAGNDYRVQEKKVLRYSLMQVTGTKNVTVKKLEEPAYGKDPARVFSVSVNLCGHPKESEVVFENQKYRWDDYGHNSIVKNRIPVE